MGFWLHLEIWKPLSWARLLGFAFFFSSLTAWANPTPISCDQVSQNFFLLHETTLQKQVLDREESLQLIQRSTPSPEGLEETVLIEQTRRGQRTLFRSTSLPDAPHAQIIKFAINSSNTFAALGYVVRGSIDHYSIVIVDLASGSIKGSVNRLSWGGVLDWNLAWRNDSSLTWSQASKEFNVTSGVVQDSMYRLKGVQDQLAVYTKKSDSTASLYFILPDGQEVVLPKAAFGYGLDVTLLGQRDGYVYYRDLEGLFQRFKIPNKSSVPQEVKPEQIPLTLPLHDSSLDPHSPTSYRSVLGLTLQGDRFFVKSAWGLDQFLTVYQINGEKLFEVQIPPYANFVSAEHMGSTRYKIRLESAVRVSDVIYDFAAGKAIDQPELRSFMLTSNHGFKIQTHQIQVVSSDGTSIPVRVTMPENTVMNKENPVLLQLYGGFGIRGPIDPKSDQREFEFLRRGGVLVNAAIRGGNEFGPTWYTAGLGRQQQNKLNDLIATARWIHSSGLAKPEKIITLSGSNGGYVIASAALQAPDAFGLVIPVNGIFDLANPAKARSLVSEYGDPRNANDLEYLLKISPLVLAQNFRGNRPEFFIFRGEADSRVNPQESLDLADALRQSNSAVQVVTIPNAGHMMQRPQIQRHQSTLFHRALWNKIFEYSGLSSQSDL